MGIRRGSKFIRNVQRLTRGDPREALKPFLTSSLVLAPSPLLRGCSCRPHASLTEPGLKSEAPGVKPSPAHHQSDLPQSTEAPCFLSGKMKMLMLSRWQIYGRDNRELKIVCREDVPLAHPANASHEQVKKATTTALQVMVRKTERATENQTTKTQYI